MLFSIDVKFIFNCQVMEIKGCLVLHNIPQIADVIHRVIFLLFLQCF